MGEVVPIEDGLTQELPLHMAPTPSPLQIITIKSGSIKETPGFTCNPDGCTQGRPGGQAINITELESWLPITESRNGNIFSAMFHILCSGIGFQALLLPVAFAVLGWTWGIICLCIVFMWQLYTIWLLVNLHEPVPGTRYSRFVRLSIVAFGQKLGKLLAIFPVMYLSGGTCVLLIITGGGTMELLFKIICEEGAACQSKSLTGTELFLLFTCIALIIGQLPNLHSVARVSLTGAIASIGYFTMIWALSISKGRPDGVSYSIPHAAKTGMTGFGNILNAIGIIMLSFRGHNLILEIQGTLPSSSKHPCRKSMWRGVMVSYIIIAMCLFPLAIVGFWAYGNKIPANGGILTAFADFHREDTSKFVIGLIYLWLILSCLSSYQIYAMPAFDNLEFIYASSKNRRCPGWVRVGLRLFFGGLTFFIAVAFPFLGSLAPLLGGMATVPLTFAYPCFMWISIKRPRRNGAMWSLNLGLGCLGIVLSVLLIVAAVWNLADKGLHANFFRP
ncbi:PREDICTED: lysine histidine transporter-like 7 [Theobroma cacao]|uniref:Lysine histidine transporter-like 7 n=1 Tax=Theobroma cacao TaxID=3641 RepID=A0AB32VW57_THECC|nr:PREDICTED: lysine histidine transporter-like 7 [Theobroma cacao]